ncbi:MAG: GNAT family N-acetyltransferase [Clostridiales bacterium]|nr:GNAT family N-acetyltransferase [Clostridiales bacterium]
MGVIVKEVKTKKELKVWATFPNKLYKKVPEFVPFLLGDEMDTFTKGKNPAYEFCDTKLFLAVKDKKIVGRIAGLINHAANEKWKTSNIRFTRFDFIDDYEVSAALINAVIEWGKASGLTTVVGPMGFTDMDHSGMLIEGYNELNMSITFYNFPYYKDHMEKLGFIKEVDWVEYQLLVSDKPNEKLKKLSAFLQRQGNYKLVTYTDRKQLFGEAFEAFKVIDVAFSKLYGTVPLTDEVINKSISDYIPLVNLDYICSVKDKDGAIVGFAVLVPSIAKALKKSNGRLLPFGLFRMLKALRGKNDTLEMFFIAVKPEYQMKGIPVIIMDYMINACVKNGVKICESGPELELNEDVQAMWKYFDVRKHKRRRCYKKDI